MSRKVVQIGYLVPRADGLVIAPMLFLQIL